MTTYLTEKAQEQGTFVINAAWYDADDDAVTPTTATWTLTKTDGTVINSRADVSISSIDTANDIVLSGNDLAVQSGESAPYRRHLLIEAVYDADEGSNLPLRDQCVFLIDDLAGM